MHGGLPPGYEDQQKFMCDQCTNVFFNEWSLKLHIKVSNSFYLEFIFYQNKCLYFKNSECLK